MSTSVYSIRIPKKIRDAMERMKDINWQEEIRELVVKRVRQEERKRLIAEGRKLRGKMKSSNISEMIREDRDAR
jgi:hypothetical protein